MQWLIYGAEAATVLWFLLFLTLFGRLQIESRTLARPRLDRPSRSPQLTAGIGFASGLFTLSAFTLAEIL